MARRVSSLLAVGAGALLGCAVIADLQDYEERAHDVPDLFDRVEPAGDADDASASDGPGPTDAAADSEADVATGPCIDCVRLVFVTSTELTGNLGGLLGANEQCQARAKLSTSAAIRGKTFIAWLSTMAAPARTTHVNGTGAYKRSDGAVVATGFADLVDGQLAQPIAIDELGNLVTGVVWTGTNLNGDKSASTCDGWTSAAAGVMGQQGRAESSVKAWTDETVGTCDTSARLYCIER